MGVELKRQENGSRRMEQSCGDDLSPCFSCSDAASLDAHTLFMHACMYARSQACMPKHLGFNAYTQSSHTYDAASLPSCSFTWMQAVKQAYPCICIFFAQKHSLRNLYVLQRCMELHVSRRCMLILIRAQLSCAHRLTDLCIYLTKPACTVYTSHKKACAHCVYTSTVCK